MQVNEYLHVTSPVGKNCSYKESLVGWSFPPDEWIKANVDGSVRDLRIAS